MKKNPVNIEVDDDFVDENLGKLNFFRFRVISWNISSGMLNKIAIRLLHVRVFAKSIFFCNEGRNTSCCSLLKVLSLYLYCDIDYKTEFRH